MKNRIILCLMFLVLVSTIGYVAYTIFNDDYYNIKFDTNGGIKLEDLKVKKEEQIYSLPVVTKDGYEFVGWYLEDELFDLNVPVKKDVTLKAKWEESESKTYTLKFDSLGGNEVNDMIVEENKIVEAPEPIKEGYKFVGWMYHNKAFDFSKPIIEDMVLVAKWKRIDN